MKIEQVYSKGKLLERRWAPQNIEVHKIGTFIEPTAEEKSNGEIGSIRFKMGMCDTIRNEYEKNNILPPDMFKYEYEDA